MIGRLHGVLLDKRPPGLLVDVHGVGYELEAPMTTFYELPEPGAEVTLHTHLVVREDAHQLYGFWRHTDRDIFRQLLKVSGVGARLALAVLSGLDADELRKAVVEADVAGLSRLPGIGKKTAERLIMELRDRFERAGTAMGVASAPVSAGPRPGLDPVAEAVSALIALGLKPQEAARRVQTVASVGLRCEEIVRRALQAMAKT